MRRDQYESSLAARRYLDSVEYERECGSIQADLARRAGSLLQQYRTLATKMPQDERYEATLALSVLGLLLVNCKEALAVMEKDSHPHLLWPLVRELVVENSETNIPACLRESVEEHAFRQVRNAVSHPVPATTGRYPVTGYVSIATAKSAEQVRGFTFIASPWARTPMSLLSVGADRKPLKRLLDGFRKSYDCDGLLAIRESDAGVFSIVDVDTENAYVPVFRVSLDLHQVEDLALAVANFLAHAHDSNRSWDGLRLRELLTA